MPIAALNPWAPALLALAAMATLSPAGAVTVRTGVGAGAADIQAAVDAFRADLGANNGLGPCAACVGGSREVNWDAVPNGFASPNAFPGSFFNQASGAPVGRVRGIAFSGSGSFEVSASSASGVAVEFGNHTPDNADDFAAFSAERIFGLIGSNQLEVSFSVPGSPDVAARVRGFGVVFTDVEVAGSTRLDFYGLAGDLLHSQPVPSFGTGGETFGSFSFAGASFDAPLVSRVRITNGSYDLKLTAFGAADDSVAMDDFIFGEPAPVPEPGSWALLLAGLAAGAAVARRRR